MVKIESVLASLVKKLRVKSPNNISEQESNNFSNEIIIIHDISSRDVKTFCFFKKQRSIGTPNKGQRKKTKNEITLTSQFQYRKHR